LKPLHLFRLVSGLLLSLLVTVSGLQGSVRSDDKTSLSTPEQMQEDIDATPCNNRDRLKAAQTLFEKMGAKSENISIDDRGGQKNLIVRKAGNDDILVIGAHYDKVSAGCGALDNWTGIIAIAHVYKTLKDHEMDKTVLFVAFSNEEEGLLGSKAMVKNIPKDQLSHYCGMINIDSLGMTNPHLAENMSSRKMMVQARDLAKKLGMTITQSRIEGADADSSSFLDRKIPAITIDAVTSDWPQILHSSNDKITQVKARSVYLGYRLALAMAANMNASACDAFR